MRLAVPDAPRLSHSEGAAPAPGDPGHRCGYVAIVGRPNVGKSTLLNRIVGQKLAITADRPQTTRHRIMGVHTLPDAQLLLLDSPGYQTRKGGALNRVLNRTARQVAADADVIVQVCDGHAWTQADAQFARLLPDDRPVLLAINKADAVKDRARMLRVVEAARSVREFAEYVPVSARTGHQVDLLVRLCANRLPVAPPAYGDDDLTDRSERFLAGELVREKLFRLLGDELPYESTVLIEQYEILPGLRRVGAVVLVERESQKAIVLGKGGERIKRIASEARVDLERLVGTKVFLEIFVKVRSGWADTEQSLRAYGYE
ncbi:MAG: GTPase Era [Burkholderiaceae bacterium]|jgi:GTP-binding protein Era|nr:GTPase Era [Burkholderiaceae bacterium]